MMEKRVTGSSSRPIAGIVIPRPRSAFTTTSNGRTNGDSYRGWMHDYHYRTHQQLRAKNLRLTTTTNHAGSDSANTNNNNSTAGSSSSKDSSTTITPRRSKGTNLFLNFTSLKISPEDNESPHRRLTSNSHAQQHTSESSDTLDGYRIYKGSGNLTLGLSKQHNNSTPVKSVSNGEDKHINHIDNSLATSHNHHILPDKFVLPSKKSSNEHNHSGAKPSPNQQPHHQPSSSPKYVTLPFHFHIQQQRRHRPHSASIADIVTTQPAALPAKEKKGTKSKHCVKKVKSVPANMSYKSPTITTIQLQSSEALTLTPRQNGTIPPSSYKLSAPCVDSKTSNNSCFQPPKSILKNHKSGIPSISQYAQLNGDENGHTNSIIPRHGLKQDNCNTLPYHELLFMSNRIPPTHTDVPQQGTPPHATPSSYNYNTIAGSREHRRPRSAVVASSSSNAELLERTSSPRRKSVTFNSYVSFLSENRVSTIRSMPVDV